MSNPNTSYTYDKWTIRNQKSFAFIFPEYTYKNTINNKYIGYILTNNNNMLEINSIKSIKNNNGVFIFEIHNNNKILKYQHNNSTSNIRNIYIGNTTWKAKVSSLLLDTKETKLRLLDNPPIIEGGTNLNLITIHLVSNTDGNYNYEFVLTIQEMTDPNSQIKTNIFKILKGDFMQYKTSSNYIQNIINKLEQHVPNKIHGQLLEEIHIINGVDMKANPLYAEHTQSVQSTQYSHLPGSKPSLRENQYHHLRHNNKSVYGVTRNIYPPLVINRTLEHISDLLIKSIPYWQTGTKEQFREIYKQQEYVDILKEFFKLEIRKYNRD